MKKIVSVSLLSIVAISFSHAAVLANWELDSLVAGDTTAAVDSTLANITAGNLNLATPASNWPNALVAAQNDPAINSLAAAISGDEYFSFTLTADAGAASYDSIFARINLGTNVVTSESTFSLLSDVTGFTSSDALDTFSVAAPTTFTVDSGTFDLSGVTELQNIAGSVEFRIYFHNTGTNPTTRIGIGQAFATNGTPDLTVNGTTVVPEPSTYAALAGLVALGSVMLRRRRA